MNRHSEKYWLKKIRQLLRRGYSKTDIRTELSLTRYKVNRYIDKLVSGKIKTPVKKLLPYDQQIKKWLAEGKNEKEIHALLCLIEPVHFDTVERYVHSFFLNSEDPNCQPGELGYLSLISINHLYSKPQAPSYLFCFLLPYSHYSYFTVVKYSGIRSLLLSQQKCFRHLGGAPASIKFCNIPCFLFSPFDLEKYSSFLAHYGATLSQSDPKETRQGLCAQQVARVRREILGPLFCINNDQLLRALKNKHYWNFNLLVHPKSQRPIQKEFELVEKKALLPLPETDYTIPAEHKVSAKGYVNYHRKRYRVPLVYAGKMVMVKVEADLVVIIYKEHVIKTYPIDNKNDNKNE